MNTAAAATNIPKTNNELNGDPPLPDFPVVVGGAVDPRPAPAPASTVVGGSVVGASVVGTSSMVSTL